MESLINIGIILTYVMVGFATLTTLVFAVKRMIQSPKDAKKTLYAIGGLVVILIAAYFFSSEEVLNSYEKYNVTSIASKRVGMGLITFYCLIFGAISAILYTELSKTFSK